MTTLELGVLVGAVVLVALVWLIPVDRRRSRESQPVVDRSDVAGAPGEPPRAIEPPRAVEPVAATASEPEPTIGVPVTLSIPVALERLESPVGSGDAESSALTAPPVLASLAAPEVPVRVEAAGAAIPPETTVATNGHGSSTAKLAVSWTKPEAAPRVLHAPAPGPQPLASTATNPVPGGAESRSAYPMAIPIPVVLAVATPAAAPEPPEPAPVAGGPPTRERPFESNSAASSSVTWSPQTPSTAVAWLLPGLWRGSQSVVARISSTDATTRRNVAIAAGAGVLLALAVARR